MRIFVIQQQIAIKLNLNDAQLLDMLGVKQKIAQITISNLNSRKSLPASVLYKGLVRWNRNQRCAESLPSFLFVKDASVGTNKGNIYPRFSIGQSICLSNK